LSQPRKKHGQGRRMSGDQSPGIACIHPGRKPSFRDSVFFDLAALKGFRYLKQIIAWRLCCCLDTPCMGVFRDREARFARLRGVVGWPLAVISGASWSTPFFSRFPSKHLRQSGVGQGLVTTGTYASPASRCAVVRPVPTGAHGDLALEAVRGGCSGVVRSGCALLWIQDRFYFPLTFAATNSTARNAMLVPTRTALSGVLGPCGRLSRCTGVSGSAGIP